jgi:hypothetical protein
MLTEQYTTVGRRRLSTRMAVVLASLGVLVAPGMARAGSGGDDAAACSTGSLRGTYGGSGTGSFAGAALGLIATVVFDGAGKVAGHGTAVLDQPAAVERFDLQQGTYTIGEDCTGTARFFVHHRTVSPIDHYHTADLVVSDGGKQVSLIYVTTEFPNAPPAPAESVTYSGHRM